LAKRSIRDYTSRFFAEKSSERLASFRNQKPAGELPAKWEQCAAKCETNCHKSLGHYRSYREISAFRTALWT
jgi:hypothetical protein